MELKELTAKAEQTIKNHGYEVIWSTDRLAEIWIDSTGELSLPDDANAVTDASTRKVTIRTDLDEWTTARSLTHELGHVLMNAWSGDYVKSEWEAECFSYAVMGHYDLGRTDVSDEYLAFFGQPVDKDSAISRAERTAERFVSV